MQDKFCIDPSLFLNSQSLRIVSKRYLKLHEFVSKLFICLASFYTSKIDILLRKTYSQIQQVFKKFNSDLSFYQNKSQKVESLLYYSCSLSKIPSNQDTQLDTTRQHQQFTLQNKVRFQQQKASLTMNHSVQQIYCSPEHQHKIPQSLSNTLKKKFLEIHQKHLGLNPEQAFYIEYCKMYIQTIRIQKQIKFVQDQIEEIKQELKNQPEKAKKNSMGSVSNEASNNDKNKRKRRMANQIARHYICPVKECEKSYGSEGSLNYHIKLKHKQLLINLQIKMQQ